MALIFPLAMGFIFVSCDETNTTKEKTTYVKESTYFLSGGGSSNGNDDRDDVVASTTTTTSTESKSQTTTECDCLEVEKKFAEIKANRNSAYSTATAQLRAELDDKPSCLQFNGNVSWSCGKYSGRDAGNATSQTVMGGF